MQRFKFIFSAFLLVFSLCVQAQDDDKPNYYQRPNKPTPVPAQPENTDTTQSPEQFEAQPIPQQNQPMPRRQSQQELNENYKQGFDMSKILIEPTFSFFFTSQSVNFGIRPSVVYDIYKKKLFAGGSFVYNVQAIFKYPVGTTTKNITVQAFGGGPVLHYNIWKGFYARIRPELLGVRIPVSYSYVGLNQVDMHYKTYAFPYLWLGAGYNLAKGLKGIFMPAGIYFDPISIVRQQNYTDITPSGAKRYQLSPYGMVYFQIGIYILDPGIGLK